MAKKKGKAQTKNAAAPEAPGDIDAVARQFGKLHIDPAGLSRKAKKTVRKWNAYFGNGDLEDYQRLCRDLGVDDSLPSKRKCRLALRKVHINIVQFLNATTRPEEVIKFGSVRALVRYTRKHHAFFPRKNIPKGSPLRTLLRILTYR